MNLFFFSKTINVFIIDLIKKDGSVICDNKLDKGYIRSFAGYCDSGYAYLDITHQIIYGFSIFSQNADNENTLEIDILCSNNNVGGLLLIKTLEYAKINNFNRCNLMAKNKDDLPKFYEKYGFKKYESCFNENNIKCYYMQLYNYNILNNYDLNDNKFILTFIEPEINNEINNDTNNEIIYIKPKLNFLSKINKIT